MHLGILFIAPYKKQSEDTFGPFPLHCLSQLNSRGTGRNIKI
ncbi:hypothetical protein SLEP1_g58313 [Rubroshorea leprosula]|uniref:Uncharacterized protein n=1 Tax=Rubroshorea leprosula TaxID=152421 RepID=A0AAV5MSZ5_9ROSI|nr:hypothetical protein SLEP1_g58313 [Rubroshorea leprosula]